MLSDGANDASPLLRLIIYLNTENRRLLITRQSREGKNKASGSRNIAFVWRLAFAMPLRICVCPPRRIFLRSARPFECRSGNAIAAKAGEPIRTCAASPRRLLMARCVYVGQQTSNSTANDSRRARSSRASVCAAFDVAADHSRRPDSLQFRRARGRLFDGCPGDADGDGGDARRK